MVDPQHGLPKWRRVLAVVAHPDDESFGLGALLDRFVAAGAQVRVLCLTRGEASTLGDIDGDLAEVRGAELRSAAAALGVGEATMCAHPDGGLSAVPPERLEADVIEQAHRVEPDGLLVFDPVAGVTGHEDHETASRAAIAAGERLGLPVLGWALPEDVGAILRAETGGGFAGHPRELLVEVPVDRSRQLEAVRCHATQAVPGSVLWRRLELLGDVEYVRLLVPGSVPSA
ncbi:PIG-L deacetylase family protein [uncultured Phycicoccus sp.]|uniref:PIG-L deacetylase family protein n=1 Tax=uncultured Phycicoccus sp. TaxID=661422 RepID=UPI00263971C5|nr:PIG-L deacetylase family protein [uncultured Phycicoccus sp.]